MSQKFVGLLDEEEVAVLADLEELLTRKNWICFSVFQHQDGDYEVSIKDTGEFEGMGKEGRVPQATIEAIEDIIYQEAEIAREPGEE